MLKLCGLEWYACGEKKDRHVVTTIVCCLLGVGALSMPSNFAKSGIIAGIAALAVTSFINIYSSALLSLTLLRAPATVVTYSDLGAFVGGFWGELAVEATQLATCLMLPIVFLILGGSLLLPSIFEGAVELVPSEWILVMVIALLPASLYRQLNSNDMVMTLGTAVVLLAYAIALADSAFNKRWDAFEAPVVEFKNVCSFFGILSLSFGLGIIIPSLQKDYPQPRRMPSLTVWATTIIALVYLLIGLIGYVQYGCTAPSNLLLSMPDGFWKRLAFVFMLINVSIAFCVVLTPAMFFIERAAFGFHQVATKDPSFDEECGEVLVQITSALSKKESSASSSEGFTTKQRIQSACFRVLLIAFLAFIAIMTQDCFFDVINFAGATTITWSCVILPCAFYYIVFRKEMAFLSKVLLFTVVLVSLALGIYSAYEGLSQIIEKASSYSLFSTSERPPAPITYPYCPKGYIHP